MKPQTIGRVLGVGVRVVARFVGQSIAGSPQTAASTPHPHAASAQIGAGGPVVAQMASRTSRSVSKGVGGFLAPFRRVGGILWLEVTGVFFLLPVIVFAPNLWKAGVAYPHTTDHRTFWVTALIVAVFLYLGASSFWRARRR